MELTVSKDILAGALRNALNVVGKSSTLPILNNVLLEARDNKLVVVGTDLDITVRTEVPVTLKEEGTITLLAKKFGQIINSLPEGEVTLKTDDKQQATISCKKSFFRLVGMDSAEFPRESAIENGFSFSLPPHEFRKILAKVSYAVCPDVTRRALNGVLLSLRGGKLTAAATDGRRLALMEKQLAEGTTGEGDVILPPKAVTEAEKLCALGADKPAPTKQQQAQQVEEPIQVTLSDRRAAFKLGGTLLTTKLVDGNYPNYRQVIPTAFASSVIIPREDFSSVLNRVAMVVTENSATVRINLENAKMTVSALSSEIGEASEPMEVSYEGKPLQIAFNPEFLSEPIKQLECDQLVLNVNDEFSPLSLTGDDGFLYIIMPMRV